MQAGMGVTLNSEIRIKTANKRLIKYLSYY